MTKIRPFPTMSVRGLTPWATLEVDYNYILALYKYPQSVRYLMLKYRQKDKNTVLKWSRVRGPKQLYWAIDVILKMQHNPDEAQAFLELLVELWNEQIQPLRTESEKQLALDVEKLKREVNAEAEEYLSWAAKGVYSIKFLYLINKLLMLQNRHSASEQEMLKKLLEPLKIYKDLYRVLSVATQPMINE